MNRNPRGSAEEWGLLSFDERGQHKDPLPAPEEEGQAGGGVGGRQEKGKVKGTQQQIEKLMRAAKLEGQKRCK